MTKNEYIQSRLGELHSVIIATQPTTSVIGSIRGDNLRNIVSILAAGLQDRLDNAPASEIKTALVTAFKYLSLPDYAINLSVPGNMAMLDIAHSLSIITTAERAELIRLATYEVPVYDIRKEDFYNEWYELPATSAPTLTLRLTEKPPETTHILFHMQDQYDDNTSSDWYYATALHNVSIVKEYKIPVPFNGHPRKIKWCCDYQLKCKIY